MHGFSRDHIDGVTVIQLDNPPVNALDHLAILSLLDTVMWEKNQGAPLVLTGGSNLFSIGLDMPAFTALDAAGQRDCANALNSLIAELVNYPAPVVSASHRAALGVGFTLMLCADYRLASNDPSSLYGLPEAAAGLAFTSGAVELMRSALPDGAIRQLALKGDSVTPEQLMALGVVDLLETPDDLLPAAVVAAQIMASQPTFGRVKRQVRGVLGARLKLLAQTGLDPFEGHLA